LKLCKKDGICYNVQYTHQESTNETWIRKNNNGLNICLENWLYKDNNGNTQFKMNESFIGFGIGRRDCVGKMLAIKELLVIFGHLLINFKWELTNKNQTIKHTAGITVMIDPPIPVKIYSL